MAEVGFHLDPHMMAAAYDYFLASKPFKHWRLPPSDEVEFHVTQHRDIYGDHIVKDGKHIIRISCTNVNTTLYLMEVMAHEMVHAYCDRRGVRAVHGPEWHAASDKVCRYHGFDRKSF